MQFIASMTAKCTQDKTSKENENEMKLTSNCPFVLLAVCLYPFEECCSGKQMALLDSQIYYETVVVLTLDAEDTAVTCWQS